MKNILTILLLMIMACYIIIVVIIFLPVFILSAGVAWVINAVYNAKHNKLARMVKKLAELGAKNEN